MANWNWKALAAFILLCEFAGFLGSAFTVPSVSGWYVSLHKPSFNPPDWVFAPVWIILYAMMGVSGYLVWGKVAECKHHHYALYLFGVQLAETVIWSMVFFGFHSPALGLAVIIFLWISIVLTMAVFYMVDRRAAYLLAPYFLWVSFAAVLNFYVWKLNP